MGVMKSYEDPIPFDKVFRFVNGVPQFDFEPAIMVSKESPSSLSRCSCLGSQFISGWFVAIQRPQAETNDSICADNIKLKIFCRVKSPELATN